MEGCCDRAAQLFERIPQDELDQDSVITAMVCGTEEGMKVKRNGQPVYYAAYRRREE
jgi:hypothetical protein